MVGKIFKTIVPVLVIVLIFLVYTSFCESFTINLLRWGEIVVIISLFAGLYRFIAKKVSEIKGLEAKSFYSAVTVLSFAVTFLAGIFNFSSERFAFNNIVREQPGYLFETTRIVIDDDSYLKKYPAKNKLALYIASKISNHFVPTDEMLKTSGIGPEDYQKLLNQNYDGTVLLKDDLEYSEKVRKKVTEVSRETVSVMIPVVEKIKDWAYIQVSTDRSEDLQLNGYVVKGSGEILQKEMEKFLPVKGEAESSGLDIYGVLSKNRQFVSIVSEKYSKIINSAISERAKKRVISSFVRTGVSVSPRMKGVIRWIYRYVYDPLFATFMAILVFFMVIAAYRHFDLRKYSTAVITLSAVFVMIGFIPQVGSFFRSSLPSSWQGPMSSGWIMNVIGTPVFKAFAIGSGTGVVFMYVGRYWRSLPWGEKDE